METFLATISTLAKQKRLYPAEQIIANNLKNFEKVVSSTNEITDAVTEKIELALLDLLNVNNGILSIQCCFRISECLLILYNRTSPPHVWNLFLQFSQNNSTNYLPPSLIITTGFVINSIGSSIKSTIPGFASKLLSLSTSITTIYNSRQSSSSEPNSQSMAITINYSIPAMISLVPCFKRNRGDMAQFSKKAFDFAKKAIKAASSYFFASYSISSLTSQSIHNFNSTNTDAFCVNLEVIQLFSIRLVRTLLKYRAISIKSLTLYASKMFNSACSSFVIDQTSYLVAKIAYFYYIVDKDTNLNQFHESHQDTIDNTSTENGASSQPIISQSKVQDTNLSLSETAIQKDSSLDINKDDEGKFNEAFRFISQFSHRFPQILKHFLDILDPIIVNTNLTTIFTNIRNINSAELPQLISFFGSELRSELFHQIANERPPTISQLHILCDLQNLHDGKLRTKAKNKSKSSNQNFVDPLNFDVNDLLIASSDNDSESSSCQKEIAALALQLCQSGSTSIRNEGANSFSWLAEINPYHAKLYLETSTLYLALPPEDNPNIQNDIRAFGTIVTHILGALIKSTEDQDNKSSEKNQKNWKRDQLANLVADNINQFLNRALLDVDILDSSFLAAFSIMTVLPKYLVPSHLATAAVSLFAEFLMVHESISELDIQRLKFVAQSISLFFCAQTNYDCFPRFLKTITDNQFLHTQTLMLALLIEAPRNDFVINSPPLKKVMRELLLNSMHPYFIKAVPTIEYLKSKLKYPMLSPSEVINYKQFIAPKIPVIYDRLESSVYAFKVLENYSKYVETIVQIESAKATSSTSASAFFTSVMNNLIQSSSSDPGTQLMCHSLIHSLSINPVTRKCFPSTFYKTIIDTMIPVNGTFINASNDTVPNALIELTRLQISAECVGLLANEFGGSSGSKLMTSILGHVNQLHPGPVKCFLYSSLFSHCQFTLDQLTSIMHELDEYSLNPSIMAYSLHALSVMFRTYSVELMRMKAADIQFQVLLNLINSVNILHPYNLYFTAQCFTNLLAVTSPEFAENQLQQETDEIEEVQRKLNEIYQNETQSEVKKHSVSSVQMMIPTIDLIVKALDQIPVPISEIVFFNTIRSVLALASEAIEIPKLHFPTTRGVTIALRAAACGAFTDYINSEEEKKRKRRIRMENIARIILQYKQKYTKMPIDKKEESDIKLENIDLSDDEIDINDIDLPIQLDKKPISLNTNENYFYLIPRNLLMLQRSCNELIIDFVSVIAKKFLFDTENTSNCTNQQVRDQITAWVKIFSSVLAQNVLPETGIESAPIVKHCCLESAVSILELLARSEPLMTENLDDMVTIITHAIETKKDILLKDAYMLLTTLIKKFEHRTTSNTTHDKVQDPDGQRLLLLYDSQFSIAVRNGFLCKLEYSGSFLIQYLHFHLEDLKTSPSDFENVLNSYVKGIMTCKQRTYAYYALSAHIICLARENRIVFEMINDIDKETNGDSKQSTSFVTSILTQLCEIFNISMALWRSTPPDWQHISQFRACYSSFYRDIVVAFAWLQAVLHDEYISPKRIIDFEIEELESCSEMWRVSAAFDVLNCIFLASPERITQEEIDKVVSVLTSASERFPQLLSSSTIAKFLNICKMISSSISNQNNDEARCLITSEQLNALSETSRFDTEATAIMITNTDIKVIVDQLNDRILAEYISNRITSQEFLALSTLVFDNLGVDKSDQNEKIDQKVRQVELKKLLHQFLLRINAISDDLTILTYLSRILKRIKIDDNDQSFEKNEYETVARFAWSRFKIGGMFLISGLLSDNPKSIGLSLFAYSELDIISKLVLADLRNAPVYIQFITMGINVLYQAVADYHMNDDQQILPLLGLLHYQSHDLDRFFASFLQKASQIAIDAIATWGPDLRGEEVIKNSAYLARKIHEIETESAKFESTIGGQLKSTFGNLGTNLGRRIVQFTENEKMKHERSQQAATKLKTFTSNIDSKILETGARKVRKANDNDTTQFNDDFDSDGDDWEAL